MVTRVMVLAVSLGLSAVAQPMEGPVAALLSSGAEAKILQGPARVAAAARVGDMFFVGDRLQSGATAVVFLSCATRTIQTVEPGAEVLFESRDVKIEKGRVRSKQPVSACALPKVVRLTLASQQRLGGLTMRTLEPPLRLTAPLGTVFEARPQFSWQKHEQADSYRVEVAENGRAAPLWSRQTTALWLAYPEDAPPLTPGSRYVWKATAVGGQILAQTEAEFEVLGGPARERLERELAQVDSLLKKNPSDAGLLLARATELERAGATSSAMEAYRRLGPEWQDVGWLKSRWTRWEARATAAQRKIR